MAKEQVKKNKVLNWFNEKIHKINKYLVITATIVIVVIAVVLVSLIFRDVKKRESEAFIYNNNFNKVEWKNSDDVELNKFIKNYFKYRTELDYVNIFKCFNRNYYKEQNSKNKNIRNQVKNIEKLIRYEKTFVQKYKDIEIWETNGINNNEKVLVIRYNVEFGFATETVPMIIIFYIINNEGDYIIKNNYDVGTIKYIKECVDCEMIKNIYDDVKTKLTRAIESNSEIKLAYNSLRQYEINMGTDINYGDVPIKTTQYDLIRDADEIYKYVKKAKEEDEKYNKLNEFITNIVSKLTDTQRIPIGYETYGF